MEGNTTNQADPEQKFIDQIQQFKEAQLDETGKVEQWLKLADEASDNPAA